MATKSNQHGPYHNLFKNYVFNGLLNGQLKAYHSFFFTRMSIKLLFQLYAHCKHSRSRKNINSTCFPFERTKLDTSGATGTHLVLNFVIKSGHMLPKNILWINSQYYCCLLCGAILDIYLDFQNCLLQLEIADQNYFVNLEISSCRFSNCQHLFDNTLEYIHHSNIHHGGLFVFFLPLLLCLFH